MIIWQENTNPRLQSLGHVSKKSPPVLQRSQNKQPRDEVEQGCSKEEIALNEASSLSDYPEDLYESLPIDKEDEVNISEVKQPKVRRSIKLPKYLSISIGII